MLRFITLLLFVAFGITGFSQQAGAFSKGSSSRIWVSKPDGSIQCQDKSLALSVGQDELKKAGVEVFNSQKGSDGLMRPQVCGAPSGALNTYEIDSKDLKKAEALGFTKTNPVL